MKNHPNKDFVAEAIADYEAMPKEQRGQLLVSVLEDQPLLMGFVTNLADDFNDSVHEALVDSAVILINAFVSAGIPIGMIPQAIVEEVIKEKVAAYDKQEEQEGLDKEITKELSDSPIVFEDLRNRALFKSELNEEEPMRIHNFNLALDTIISIVERSAAIEIDKKEEQS